MLNEKEKANLRALAERYMEAASLPAQREKIELWKALNAGRMRRPMVAIDQLPWHELNDDGSLTVTTEDPFWRGVEQSMRRTLYKWERFPADMVIEPVLPIPMAISGDDYGIKVLEDVVTTDKNNDVASHRYLNQLDRDEDILNIKDMNITHDADETARRMDTARELFNGIIPVREQGVMFHLGTWDKISTMMGVEAAYLNLLDRPEFIHKIMRRFTDATLRGVEQINALNAYDGDANVCHCSYVYTDELLPDVGGARGNQTRDSWAYGLAQLFSSVSPAVTEEFELPYVTELAKHFGAIYYGCCDRLDDRLDVVKRIPNLRKVSCSPWSEREAFAERIGPKLTMSAKPSPAFIAGTNADLETAAADLKRTVAAASRYGVNLEIILKDISTVNYRPDRLTEWNRIASEIVNAG